MSKESDQWVSYVEDILHEMKDKKVLVSQVTYHGMMNVFAKSSSRDGAKKAEEFLRGMAAEGLSLSEMSYNICIDAYARRGDHRKAQSLVEEMLSLSDRGNIECRPSIHSFASVVRFFLRCRPQLRSNDLTSFTCHSPYLGQCSSKIWRYGCSGSCGRGYSYSRRT
jgi:pentatricopeptide repeat protein